MKLFPFARSALRLPPVAPATLSDRTAPLPRVVWIELSSRCPFDCVFCSRKLRRGAGEYMDFQLYERLIASLGDAAIIRLNYSGESAHHPKIVEACRLAAATGARVELVSALASLPEQRVAELAHAGLSQLSISLHTLEAEQFQSIYRGAGIEAMRQRIERVAQLAATAPRPLKVDLALVAMRRNLDQIAAIAAYARDLGLGRLAIHPVIRRDAIEERFSEELDGDRLRPEFLAALRLAVEQARRSCPGLAIEVSTPELQPATPLDHEPRPFPGPLPAGAVIHGCEQDPWETLHVLADGRVVSCEQRDHLVLGDLANQSLGQIWQGPAYTQFRQRHAAGADDHCRCCPYKRVHWPAPPASCFVAPAAGQTCLLDGWYSADADAGVRWSRQRAELHLAAGGPGWLRLRGLLPAGPDQANGLRILANGVLLASVVHGGRGMKPFALRRRVSSEGDLRLTFAVERPYCPSQRGEGGDARELGIALIEASWQAA